MKVRVCYTVDVDDDFRLAVNDWYGRPGRASRQQIQDWYEANGHSMDLDMGAADDEDGYVFDRPRDGWDGFEGVAS